MSLTGSTRPRTSRRLGDASGILFGLVAGAGAVALGVHRTTKKLAQERWRRLWVWTARVPRIHTLKRRLTIACAVLSLLILIATFWTLSHTVQAAVRDEAERHAADLASYFSVAVAEAVAARDPLQINVLSRSMLQSRGVKAVSVISADGHALFPPDSSPEITATANDTRAGLATSRPIHFGDRRVGVVSIWLDRDQVETKLTEANAFVYPITALALLSMLLLGFAAMHSPFRALRRMTGAMERIGAGDLSARVHAVGTDEVAAFGATFNNMAERLAGAREEIARKHIRTIEAMISAVEAKDRYTRGHCLRVRNYAQRILASCPEVHAEEAERIETAALLHDVGKIGIPDGVLLKDGRLDEAEIAIIQSHVTIGEEILIHLDSMADVAHWVRHHHERWDGLGYPDGLRGKSIPFASRVIAVADCIDAMLTTRPYRTGRAPELVLRVIQEESGRQFDPEIVARSLPIVRAAVDEATRS